MDLYLNIKKQHKKIISSIYTAFIYMCLFFSSSGFTQSNEEYTFDGFFVRQKPLLPSPDYQILEQLVPNEPVIVDLPKALEESLLAQKVALGQLIIINENGSKVPIETSPEDFIASRNTMFAEKPTYSSELITLVESSSGNNIILSTVNGIVFLNSTDKDGATSVTSHKPCNAGGVAETTVSSSASTLQKRKRKRPQPITLLKSKDLPPPLEWRPANFGRLTAINSKQIILKHSRLIYDKGHRCSICVQLKSEAGQPFCGKWVIKLSDANYKSLLELREQDYSRASYEGSNFDLNAFMDFKSHVTELDIDVIFPETQLAYIPLDKLITLYEQLFKALLRESSSINLHPVLRTFEAISEKQKSNGYVYVILQEYLNLRELNEEERTKYASIMENLSQLIEDFRLDGQNFAIDIETGKLVIYDIELDQHSWHYNLLLLQSQTGGSSPSSRTDSTGSTDSGIEPDFSPTDNCMEGSDNVFNR